MFKRPVFPLWGDGRAIVGGLYDAFAGYGVTLADFTSDNTGDLADQGVTVTIRGYGTFAFRFERVEWTMQVFSDDTMKQLAKLLTDGVDWIRTRAGAGELFQNHFMTCAYHGDVEGTNSRAFLNQLPQLKLGIGEDIGGGTIFNFDMHERTRAQVFVDHSHVVADGLFVQQTLLVAVDRLDYSKVLDLTQRTLDAVLHKLQLQLVAEGHET